MPYESIDRLQNVLAEKVFSYTNDAKKAAGRALGTLVEIITFYLLKSWGFEESIAIETALAEYGRPEITHNVEFSLHPIVRKHSITIPLSMVPLTAQRILRNIKSGQFKIEKAKLSTGYLLTSDGVLRNSCIVAQGDRLQLVDTLGPPALNEASVTLVKQVRKPFAIFECKRVGVEEGMRKGPQTIEKAKQGAYVAKAVSSVQKVRTAAGDLVGLIYRQPEHPYLKPHLELMGEIVATNDPDLLRDFILTVGIVSNHGNWFTSDDHNKELKVLAQSYDWLLFLTDLGLSTFISELLLDPIPELEPARAAFLASYSLHKKGNRFTKVQMDYKADQVLQKFFQNNAKEIQSWFNIIAPKAGSILTLLEDLSQLRSKEWSRIHRI